MINGLSKGRLSVPLPQWEKIVPKSISKVFLKNQRRLKTHKAVIPVNSETRTSRSRHERSPLKFDSLYDSSPNRKKSKLLSFRLENKTFVFPEDSPRGRTSELRFNATKQETDFFRDLSESLEREVKNYKKIISKNLRELSYNNQAVLTKQEEKLIVKSYSDLRPRMYTMSKGGTNYRKSMIRKKYDLGKNRLIHTNK